MTNRFALIRSISERSPPTARPNRAYKEMFGEHVFDERAQREYLAKEAFAALQQTIKQGKELGPDLAKLVARGMKEWALQRGATHYCHWFQPLTDLTAEKQEGFYVPGKTGGFLAEFSGEELIRGEPDASSFPTGGLRTTFEARGYTAWDAGSPAFLMNSVSGTVLVIPTMFLSWTGDALDKKTPLLRSMEALSKHAVRLLRLFGDEKTQRVFPTAGAEQEYFLIDKLFYHARPDLLTCGRTLFGAHPPKGQELEDQYLGAIPDRILAVMTDVEAQLIRLGVPIKTRHNEVAPSQYELALTFQTANLAADQQMVVMEVLKKVALRHQMVCLLHEKPFAAINGSGKHTNWSLAKESGANLLEPGETPHENAQFLLFCAAVLRAAHRYGHLLRLSIASASNDHRLGKHEAPPAILSVFLGEQLRDIFRTLQTGKPAGSKQGGKLALGVSHLPHIPRHSSDRNRTSPFAFTGNKFEFRAVGSLENISKPLTFLNTIVAESLDAFATELEKAKELHPSVAKLLARESKAFESVVFEGDNYDASWQKEAKRRGLPNLTDTVDAAPVYTARETVALFTKYNVYSKRELESRQEILLTKYIKKLHIEAKTASMMAHTMIIPAALSYLKELGSVDLSTKRESMRFKELSKRLNLFEKALAHLDELGGSKLLEGLKEQAEFMRDHILPALEELRSCGDRLEQIVSDTLWPLPKYSEMLFIR